MPILVASFPISNEADFYSRLFLLSINLHFFLRRLVDNRGVFCYH